MTTTEATTCGECGVSGVLTGSTDPRIHKSDCPRTDVSKEAS